MAAASPCCFDFLWSVWFEEIHRSHSRSCRRDMACQGKEMRREDEEGWETEEEFVGCVCVLFKIFI